jgi:HK97 family phage major capsid protein
MNKLEKLRLANAELAKSMTALAALAEAESRHLTEDEATQFGKWDEEFKTNEAEIARLERLAEIQAKTSQPQPRIVQPMDETTTVTPISATGATITGGTQAAWNYPNHGFKKGPGEFLLAVYKRGTDGYRDPRLMVDAVTTFGGETVGADGAFALPPAFLPGIMDAVMPEESFLRALNPVQTNSNVLVVPKNEKAPWSATGITSAKTSEGAAGTVSKPAIGEARITIYKALSLVHVSEEALSDMPFLSSWVFSQMGQHLNYQLENWVINGTGEGEPLGILNAACTIALSDADSTASAIGAVDVLTMEANLLPGGSAAFWVGNPTIFPAIASMKTGSAGYPLFQPDMTQPSRQSLLGRPFYRSEACPILNVTGDLILVQPGGYIFATKAGGVQASTTVGFAFDQDLQSFKATIRAGGAPLLSAKVERAKSAGSTFASHFVVITGGRS